MVWFDLHCSTLVVEMKLPNNLTFGTCRPVDMTQHHHRSLVYDHNTSDKNLNEKSLSPIPASFSKVIRQPAKIGQACITIILSIFFALFPTPAQEYQTPGFCTWNTYTYTPYIHLAVLLLLLCNYLHHTIAILMYSVCNFFTLFSPWRKKCRETLDIRMWKRWLIQVTHWRC